MKLDDLFELDHKEKTDITDLAYFILHIKTDDGKAFKDSLPSGFSFVLIHTIISVLVELAIQFMSKISTGKEIETCIGIVDETGKNIKLYEGAIYKFLIAVRIAIEMMAVERGLLAETSAEVSSDETVFTSTTKEQ